MDSAAGGSRSGSRRVSDADIPDSSHWTPVDRLANRLDLLDPSDLYLSERSSSCLGPTFPSQHVPERNEDFTMSAHGDSGGAARNSNNTESSIFGDEDIAPSPPNKGKTSENACSLPLLPFSSESNQSQKPEVPAAAPNNVQRSHSSTASGGEPSGTYMVPAETIVAEEDNDCSGHTTSPESRDPSYSSSVFEEAPNDGSAATRSALVGHVTSWKQKQKQKEDPRAEIGSSSSAFDDQTPFQPPGPGDVGWEKSAGRPPQKLPIRFRDAVGRNFLFPWEKAKTWTGMGRLVQSCFLHVDVIGPHVMAGHYDLSVNLPFPMDAANEIMSPGSSQHPVTPISPLDTGGSSSSPAGPSTSAPGSSNSAGTSPQPPQQQQKSSFVVLPELWEDTIEPGMLVVQHLWPLQTPNYIVHPVHPSPPPPPQPQLPPPPPPLHHGGNFGVHPPSGRGHGTRGRGRGAGAGAGVFGGRGGAGGGIFYPPPPPGGLRPTMIHTIIDPPHRGKTRKRQDR